MKGVEESEFFFLSVPIGNSLNNHHMMGSLRMFGAVGLLLIFIALGTHGQLLTEKIPLGKLLVPYGNFHIRSFVMSCWPFSIRPTSIHISFHSKTKKGFARDLRYAFSALTFYIFSLLHVSFMCSLEELFLQTHKKGWKAESEEKQTENYVNERKRQNGISKKASQMICKCK